MTCGRRAPGAGRPLAPCTPPRPRIGGAPRANSAPTQRKLVWRPAQAVEIPLKLSQTAAVLEVVHSAAGLVRSPVAITGDRSPGRTPL